MNEARVCAVLISYRPSQDVVRNVELILDQLENVIIVDNTGEVDATDALRTLESNFKCTIIQNKQNLGIAAALNIGIREAIAQGFQWIITFDQDSRISKGYIDGLISTYVELRDLSKIGVVCPIYRDARLGAVLALPRGSDGQPIVYMTSGSLMRSETYLKLGPFEDELFIDGVDHEYALRMRAAGYKIIESRSAILEHSLGKMTPHVFAGRRIFVTNHNPQRRYFITRNRIVLLRRYMRKDREWAAFELTDFWKGTVALLLFEQDRWLKIKYMLRAAWDAIFGRLGSRGIMPGAS